MDGLNWDLLNDGLENPKNTKSLLLAHQTPPAMSLGVRETSSTAVRAGIRHILFTQQPEEVANAIDEYLKSLKPVPSPHLGDGHLTETAKRGQQVFTRAGCVRCHPPGVFTNGRSYNVGTQGKHDKPGEEFDTPTLVELWRTAPYLHDGSATNLQELLTIRNRENQHGYTSELGPAEIEALCAYLLSL
jgi:cytochrome c peroxidase